MRSTLATQPVPEAHQAPAALRERVLLRARQLGFDAVGIARADQPLELEFERYERFVDEGKAGVMTWLAAPRETRRRLDGPAILEGAKSVICLARRYQRSAEAEAQDPTLAKLVARYARGHDYHNQLRKKLRLLAKFVRGLGAGVQARPLCDEEPLLERAWAARAGLGFIGKNGLLLIPGQGSFVLLGEVVTTLELPVDAPMAERCGSCTRCLEACPTAAFDAPYVLDPRRCIAYATIEDPLARAPELVTPEQRGDHLFGCDDCQTVCPFNRTPAGDPARTRMFEPLEVFARHSLEDLTTLDEPGFLAFVEGSPLRRAGREGLARNAALVLRNQAPAGVHAESTEPRDPLVEPPVEVRNLDDRPRRPPRSEPL